MGWAKVERACVGEREHGDGLGQIDLRQRGEGFFFPFFFSFLNMNMCVYDSHV